ncbi:MAG: DUF1405 domain-containing protein [Haloferacaceae archaeon]
MNARGDGDGEALPRWLAPLPRRLEEFGLRWVWAVVAINLAGTAFGFWYYSGQFGRTPIVGWPFVPDSPMATLFVAIALALWALDRRNEYVTALAFYGNVKLGLWTPWVLAAFADQFLRINPVPMYTFLFVSHLGMVAQAFLLHRISAFPTKAVGVALAWYTVDLTVDYFFPVFGRFTHTWFPPARNEPYLGTSAFLVAAWAAVILTIVPTFLALATRGKKLEARAGDGDVPRL